MTVGPTLDFFLDRDGRRYQLGDTAQTGMAHVYGRADVSAHRQHWNGCGIQARRLELICSNGVLDSTSLEEDGLLWQQVNLPKGWIRLEMYGAFQCVEDCLLGVTSPMYLE